MVACRTCELIERRDRGGAPTWDSIVRFSGWDLVHSYDTSLEGWLVLVARRHIESLADLTDGEAAELGSLIRRVSAAQIDVTGCVKTYVAQFAEHPQHPHVHVHVVARSADLPDADIGPNVFRRLGVPVGERVGEDRMTALALALRAALGWSSFQC